MEVHHHSHTSDPPDSYLDHRGRKKWTHYFWEFLMLFLAVFCGFLAEYQLEHKIERDRAKELARSLYEELKSDSVVVAEKYEYRIKQENACKYLMNYFKDSPVVNVSKKFVINFVHAAALRTPTLFEPRTVILEQLKNSGSLRYFKSKEMQKLIGDLSIAIHNVNDRQALETSVRQDHINTLLVAHYDYDFSEMITKEGTISVTDAINNYERSDNILRFEFKSPEKLDRQKIINSLGLYGISGLRSTRFFHFKRYMDVNAALLKLLRKEYHLE